MIKFALCDDDVQSLLRLKKALENIFIRDDLDASIVFTTRNPEKLLDFINRNEVNVLFLDINLKSQYNGIDIAKEIRKNNKYIYIIS